MTERMEWFRRNDIDSKFVNNAVGCRKIGVIVSDRVNTAIGFPALRRRHPKILDGRRRSIPDPTIIEISSNPFPPRLDFQKFSRTPWVTQAFWPQVGAMIAMEILDGCSAIARERGWKMNRISTPNCER